MAQTSRDFGEYLRRSLRAAAASGHSQRRRPGQHLAATRAGAVFASGARPRLRSAESSVRPSQLAE